MPFVPDKHTEYCCPRILLLRFFVELKNMWPLMAFKTLT